MKLKIVIAAITVVLLCAGVFIALHKTSKASAQQGNLAALKELRDSGVITSQEYDAKVQALQASASAASSAPATSADPAASAGLEEKIASLKELRDSGVITAQEYDAKVQALQAGAPATMAPAAYPNSPAAKIGTRFRHDQSH